MRKHRGARAADAKDLQLLEALARDAWLSYGELAERVHLSASAVQRRVERLIAERKILGARAQISPAATGRPLRLYVLVELRDESKATINELVRTLSKQPVVVEASYVAGRTDIMLVAHATDMQEFSRFAETCLNGNPRVRRYQSLAVLNQLI